MTARLTARRAAGAGLLAALLSLVGCSEGPPEGEVSGLVTIDGQPAPERTYITFLPTDGTKSPQGCDVKEGKYALRVPVGLAKVTVTAVKEVGKRKQYPTPDSPMIPILDTILPKKYNSETTLTFEVVAGKQEKSWELSTKGK